MNVSSIGSFIREQREQARTSIRQLAQAAGVSDPYLSQIERGLRNPSAEIMQQIARGLRISADVLYVQAGILEDRPGGTGVRDAVLIDPELTERQKQMLIELYDSFRKEAALAAELTGAAEPAGLTGAGEAAEPTEPAEHGKPAEHGNRAEHGKPAEQGNRAEHGKPAEQGKRAEAAERANAAKPARDGEPAEGREPDHIVPSPAASR